jgi:hypothetical protein
MVRGYRYIHQKINSTAGDLVRLVWRRGVLDEDDCFRNEEQGTADPNSLA